MCREIIAQIHNPIELGSSCSVNLILKEYLFQDHQDFFLLNLNVMFFFKFLHISLTLIQCCLSARASGKKNNLP